MKKNIALLLFATLILSAGFSAEKKIELKVWESSGSEQSYIMYAIKEFKKVNPKVRIRYEPVESTDARNKIELDGPAGVGADIFVAPHDHIGALVTGNHILPVDNADEYMKDFLSLQKKPQHSMVLFTVIRLAQKRTFFFTTKIFLKIH